MECLQQSFGNSILVSITTILAKYCHNTCKYWVSEYTQNLFGFKPLQNLLQNSTCRVKLASTLPAWFCETHMKGPESSGLAWVKTKVDDFSKSPISWIMNCCCPLLTRELFRISVPSRYQWIFEEGTELMEHDRVAFSPENRKKCNI